MGDNETPTPEHVFWQAVRDGYSYEDATAKQRHAEDIARRGQTGGER